MKKLDNFSNCLEVLKSHIYNEQEVDEMILLIRDSFIPAFVGLEKTLRSKLEEVKMIGNKFY